jgi:hypothetical protein
VPFRQCKLTELLFSNSFPSPSLSHSPAHRRPPQKGVMIVTADPLGDFNATSQILRYSALAREITVPRIPSITTTILASQPAYPSLPQTQSSPSSSPPVSSPLSQRSNAYFPGQARTGPFSSGSDSDRETMENAAMEIARMTEIIDQLTGDVARETNGRVEAEAHLLSMEDRLLDLEQEIREDCYADFEQRLAVEMARWKASLSIEVERGEEHWDRKVEVLARSVGVTVTGPSDEDGDGDGDEDDENDKENVLIENLEQENDRLRREIAVLKRELTSRTPSKRAPLQERADMVGVKSELSGLGTRMENMRISPDNAKAATPKARVASNGSPEKKKMRKLTTRRWEGDDDLM